MKSKFKVFFMTVITIMALFAGCYNAKDPKYDIYVADLGYAIIYNGEEAGYDYILYQQGNIPHEIIQNVMNQGYLLGYVDELKALGYIDADYYPPGAAPAQATETPATTTEQPSAPVVKEPEPFTVEVMDPPVTMWVTANVNYRSGASTEYNKVGSLNQYDEVTVTGTASTGWYELTFSDGTKVYVSNKYLTTEDLHNRTVYDYNEDTGLVDNYEFTDTDPEVIDEIVEEIKSTEEETTTESETESEPETETVEPTEEQTVSEPETVIEPEEIEENGTNWYTIYLIVGIVIAAIIAVVMIVKKRK